MKPAAARVLAAAALFVALSFLALRHYCPALPNPLAVDLILPSGQPGQSEPIAVAGRTHFGDFLYIRYVDETHVIFGYDSWGQPGHVGTVPVKISPGQPLHLRLTMPAFVRMTRDFADPPGPLRVDCDGVTVLAASVPYFVRHPAELFLAENPLGGSACGPILHGRLVRPDGRELRGGIRDLLPFRERLAAWFRSTFQPYTLLPLCTALAFGWFSPLRFSLGAALGLLAQHRWFAGTVAVSAAVFAVMVTWGELRFIYPERLGSFYDYQAASLLAGHLDVPDEAIGSEAFVYGGKLYGYFGPTPALLRIPFVIFDLYFGSLSRSFMLAYFVAALTAGYLLLRQAFRLVAPAAEPSPCAIVLFLSGAGLGSTLFYLGSRSFVYHEAILCGAAFALFSCFFSLRYLTEPAQRGWLWALVCGLLSLHARPPTGLFALTFLGCVSAAHLLRALRQRPSAPLVRPLAIGALCLGGVLTFNGLSYLKFHTFEGAPLRYSRPYDAERLAKIDSKNFHAANLPSGVSAYLLRPNLRLEPHFPWIYLGASSPAPVFPGAKLVIPDPTNALPFAMPGLFALATLGCGLAWIRHPVSRRAILLLWLAVMPMSLALLAAVATAHRYTGDFVPFLVCAAALGLAAAESVPSRWLLVTRAALAALTLAAILQSLALTITYQRELAWGVPEEFRQDYQKFRQRIDHFFRP